MIIVLFLIFSGSLLYLILMPPSKPSQYKSGLEKAPHRNNSNDIKLTLPLVAQNNRVILLKPSRINRMKSTRLKSNV